jgi:hypothetical protein
MTPTLETGHTSCAAAYAKAVRDVAGSVAGGVFVAGESWPTVWTRDAAYAIDLGCGLLHPSTSITTLRGIVGSGGVWPQDRAAHFGGWPHLTDAIAGAIGAWASCAGATP